MQVNCCTATRTGREPLEMPAHLARAMEMPYSRRNKFVVGAVDCMCISAYALSGVAMLGHVAKQCEHSRECRLDQLTGSILVVEEDCLQLHLDAIVALHSPGFKF